MPVLLPLALKVVSKVTSCGRPGSSGLSVASRSGVRGPAEVIDVRRRRPVAADPRARALRQRQRTLVGPPAARAQRDRACGHRSHQCHGRGRSRHERLPAQRARHRDTFLDRDHLDRQAQRQASRPDPRRSRDRPRHERRVSPARESGHRCHTAPVTTKRLGIVVAVLVFDAALLLIAGAAMWSDAPSSAEEAVGKGLTVLGTALGIPAFLLLCAFLDAWADAALAAGGPARRRGHARRLARPSDGTHLHVALVGHVLATVRPVEPCTTWTIPLVAQLDGEWERRGSCPSRPRCT